MGPTGIVAQIENSGSPLLSPQWHTDQGQVSLCGAVAGEHRVPEGSMASAHQLRSVQRLLWDALAEQLPVPEQDEFKRALGTSVLDENAGLLAEACALADILGDVQLSSSVLLARQQLVSNPQRNMVESEILLVMEQLRGMAGAALFAGSAAKDRDPESLLPRGSVYEYISSGTSLQVSASMSMGHGFRPSTSSSRPLTASSRPSTPSSVISGAQGVQDPAALLRSMQGKLSVFELDEVKGALGCALREERVALMDDISYLTALLTDETDMQAKADAPPPTLVELRDYSTKLQGLVAGEQARLQHEGRVSKMFAAAGAEAGRAGRLRGMVGASRQPQPLPALPSLLGKEAEEGARGGADVGGSKGRQGEGAKGADSEGWRGEGGKAAKTQGWGGAGMSGKMRPGSAELPGVGARVGDSDPSGIAGSLSCSGSVSLMAAEPESRAGRWVGGGAAEEPPQGGGSAGGEGEWSPASGPQSASTGPSGISGQGAPVLLRAGSAGPGGGTLHMQLWDPGSQARPASGPSLLHSGASFGRSPVRQGGGPRLCPLSGALPLGPGQESQEPSPPSWAWPAEGVQGPGEPSSPLHSLPPQHHTSTGSTGYRVRPSSAGRQWGVAAGSGALLLPGYRRTDHDRGPGLGTSPEGGGAGAGVGAGGGAGTGVKSGGTRGRATALMPLDAPPKQALPPPLPALSNHGLSPDPHPTPGHIQARLAHGLPSSGMPPPAPGHSQARRLVAAGSLLEAQLQAAQGGVAAILARHNYSAVQNKPRPTQPQTLP